MECDFLMQKVIMLISIITEGHRPNIESNQRPPSVLCGISGVFVQGLLTCFSVYLFSSTILSVSCCLIELCKVVVLQENKEIQDQVILAHQTVAYKSSNI